MNRLLTTMTSLAVGVLMLLSGVQISAAKAGNDEPSAIALLAEITPPVQIRRADKEEFIAASKDDLLYAGDRLRCGKVGYANVLFVDSGVELILLPQTDLTLQGDEGDEGQVRRMFLRLGKLLTVVINGELDVVTGTSVASVKGTTWWTMVDADQTTSVYVLEGDVQVENRASGSSVIVSDGMKAITDNAGLIQVQTYQAEALPEIPPIGPEQRHIEIELKDKQGNPKKIRIEFE
ncbi:MAG: FecR domain-containing protein [bacterium]